LISAGVATLADAIRDNGAISSVNLLENDILMEQAEALANVIKEHPTLKSLCGNSGEEMELDMSGKKIGADGAIMLAPEIAGNGALSKFVFSAPRLIQMEASMTDANFSGKEIGVSGAIMLSAFLRKCTSLLSLNLANNNLGQLVLPAGWEAGYSLGAAGLKTAENGGFKGMGPSKENGGAASHYMHRNCGNRKQHPASEPMGVIAIANGIMECRSMTRLDLSSNAMGAEGVTHIARAIKNLKAISHLDISTNNIVCETYIRAPERCGVSSRRIGLPSRSSPSGSQWKGIKLGELIDGNPVISDDDPHLAQEIQVLQLSGIKSIASAISSMKSISTVVVDKATLPIQDIMTKAELDLSGKELNSLDAFVIAALLPLNQVLLSLNLSDNNLVSRTKMAMPMPGMKKGDLINCSPISVVYSTEAEVEIMHCDGIKAIAIAISNLRSATFVDITKNNIPFSHALFHGLALHWAANRQATILCKDGNVWGGKDCFHEGLFEKDALSLKTKTTVDLRDRNLQGHVPWDVVEAMIQHRSLRCLLLGHNKFQDTELPQGLDLNGLEELDLSGIESLAGHLPKQASAWKSLKVLTVNGTLLRAPLHLEQYGNVLSSIQNPIILIREIFQSLGQCRADEGDPQSIAPRFTDSFRRMRVDRLARYHKKGIWSSMKHEMNQTVQSIEQRAWPRPSLFSLFVRSARLMCYEVCFMCCIPRWVCIGKSQRIFQMDMQESRFMDFKDGTMAQKIDKFWSALAARVPQSFGEMCFFLSFDGYLLNKPRLILTIAAIIGTCMALINSYANLADEISLQKRTNATIGTVYTFLGDYCDHMPEEYYDGAHFDFWTIWLLISLYCGASIIFVFLRALSGAVMRSCLFRKRITFQAVLQCLGEESEIDEAAGYLEKTTAMLMFGGPWVLASSCAVHYFLLFGSPGYVGGGSICRAAYMSSVALYKPVQIPMLQCIVKLLSARFGTDQKRIDRLKLHGLMIWFLTFWYLAPLAAAVPLGVVFLPATALLFAFMAAPCMMLYIFVVSIGTATRYLRITGLKQQKELGKAQRVRLQQCTPMSFQNNPMACIELIRGFSVPGDKDRNRASSQKVVPVNSDSQSEQAEAQDGNEGASITAKQRWKTLQLARNWKGTPLMSAGGFTAHSVLTERHTEWQKVYEDNNVEHLLQEVKLQMLKVIVFGGFALVAYINLGLIMFYEHLDWSSALTEASGSVRWPNFKLVFELCFDLPRFFMFNFDWEVQMFFALGFALIIIDELIKRIGPFIYIQVLRFSCCQVKYNIEKVKAKLVAQCKLEELGVQPDDMATVSQAIDQKAKDEPKLKAVFAAAMPLVQGPLTVAKVEALLEAVGLTKEQVLGMLARSATPLVQRKLEELGVQPEDVTTVSAVLLELVAADEPKLKAVFAAAMPLVQGPLTVAKVEALLEAVGIEKPELVNMLANAVVPLV
jgi:hypothetical protein